MKVKKMIGDVMRPAVFIGALVVLAAGVTGCAVMKESLGTEHLQDEAKDPRVSIVLLHFKTQQLPPIPKGFFKGFFTEGIGREGLWLEFAVANESTGWSFRLLNDRSGEIFRPRDDLMEPDPQNVETGWVIFLAPPGLSYIAATTSATQFGRGGQDLVATPLPDRISVGYSADRAKSGLWIMDYIDTPRFAVQVPGPRSLIYAGTIVRSFKCDKEKDSATTCPYELTVVDESEIARIFVSRYQRNFPVASPMQTQLLTIPQSRTIEIRGGSAGHDPPRQRPKGTGVELFPEK